MTTKAQQGIPPKVVKIIEELSCELTDSEWQSRARDLAEAHKEVARTPPIEEEPVESTSDEPLIKEIDRFKLNDDEYLYEFNTSVDQPIYSKNGKAITEKAFTDAFNKAQGAKAKDVENEEEPEDVDPFDELDEEDYDQSA